MSTRYELDSRSAAPVFQAGERLPFLTGSGSIAINGKQTMSNNRFLARTTSGNITIGASGGVSSTAAGTGIILAASSGDFINNAGASALLDGNGRWLVYSTNPAGDSDGGLSSNFRDYTCLYGGQCPSFPDAGNGFLYSSYPVLTLTSAELNLSNIDPAQSLFSFTHKVSGLPVVYCKDIESVSVCYPM